jgi:ATP-dependent DNA ligase
VTLAPPNAGLAAGTTFGTAPIRVDRRSRLMPRSRSELSKSKRQYVQSLNTLAKPLASKTVGAKSGLFPAYGEPMLATLRDQPPSGAGWLHEIKHDGYRLPACREGDRVWLFTRNGRDWALRFPTVVEAPNGSNSFAPSRFVSSD